MMQNDVVPPHPGIKGRLNHRFPPLAKMNVHIPESQIAFKAPSGGDGRRRILLNNFNATVSRALNAVSDGAPAHFFRVGTHVCYSRMARSVS